MQHDAGVAGDDPRAERGEEAVDERHRVAILVDDGEVGGVAAHADVAVRRRVDRLLRIDQRAPAGGVVLRQQLLHRHLRERRVGDVPVAIGEGDLRRFDQRVVVEAGLASACDVRSMPSRMLSEEQRGQPLAVRRQLVERVAAIGRRDRLDPVPTCAPRSPPSTGSRRSSGSSRRWPGRSRRGRTRRVRRAPACGACGPDSSVRRWRLASARRR